MWGYLISSAMLNYFVNDTMNFTFRTEPHC